MFFVVQGLGFDEGPLGWFGSRPLAVTALRTCSTRTCCLWRSGAQLEPYRFDRSPTTLRIGSGSLRTRVGMATIWSPLASCGWTSRSTTSILYLPGRCSAQSLVRLTVPPSRPELNPLGKFDPEAGFDGELLGRRFAPGQGIAEVVRPPNLLIRAALFGTRL